MGDADSSAYWGDSSSVGLAGGALYATLAVGVGASLAVDIFRSRSRLASSLGGAEAARRRVSRAYHAAAALFCALRVAGFLTLDVSSAVAAHFLVVPRRLGFAASFSMYSAIVFWWLTSYGGSGRRAQRLRTRVLWLLVGLNVAAYASAVLFWALWIGTAKDPQQLEWDGNFWYEASVWTCILIDCATQVIVVALVLLVFLRQRNEVWFLRAGPRDVGSVLASAAIFFVCDLATTVMLLLRPLGYRVSSSGLFYSIAFFVPEIVAAVAGMAVIHAGRLHTTGVAESSLVGELFREAHKSPLVPASPSAAGVVSFAGIPSVDAAATARTPLLMTSSPAMPVRALNAYSVPSTTPLRVSTGEMRPSPLASVAPAKSVPPVLNAQHPSLQ